MGYVRTYSPEDLIIQVGGNEIVGWNSVKVERTTPVFKQIEGIRGSVARTQTLRSSATITLSIDQNSTSNLMLNMLLKLDERGQGELLNVFIKDSTMPATVGGMLVDGGTTIQSLSCYIDGYPDVEFTDESVDRVWTIRALSVTTMNIGQGYSMREYLIEQGLAVLSPYINSATSAISESLPSITRLFK